jgi:hypothetical protein
MESESLLLCSQKPTTGICPEPVEASPHRHIMFPLRSTLILSFHLCLGIPSGFFPLDVLTKILYAFLIFQMF